MMQFLVFANFSSSSSFFFSILLYVLAALTTLATSFNSSLGNH